MLSFLSEPNKLAWLLFTISASINLSFFAAKFYPINPTTHCDNPNHFLTLNRQAVEHFSSLEFKQKSKSALRTASTFSGEHGDGMFGWLWLLAAVDYDRSNFEAIDNLVTNYNELQSGLSALAYSELIASTLSDRQISALMPSEQFILHNTSYALLQRQIALVGKLPRACEIKAFTTMIASWNLTTMLPRQLNDEIYRRSIKSYEKLRRKRPDLDATSLNHEFFKSQMSRLETSSTYWGNFKDVVGFDDLILTMRRASQHLLEGYGYSSADALRKASHPLVVWVSVHSHDSEHQPHVTNDALIGGVYYVRAPENSGHLEMFDPRGKHPLKDLVNPTAPAAPPFHRGLAVQPQESKLVLFPGWLVHSVRRTVPGQSLQPAGAYRVSLSLNLKGEWQDTGSLHFGDCVP